MFWKNLSRKALIVVALGALLVLGACTLTVQPESATPTGGDGESAPPESEVVETDTVAEFVLPDGTSCLFSGTGATVAFDGKRANYTCTPIDATESATQTLAILDDPVIAGPTEYLVDFATIAQTDGGFELHASEVITFTAWEIVLEDGRVCLHAGFGATMGFDDKRLNYTCDKGESTADEVGLMGELTKQGEGVWLAQIDEIGRDANGFVQLSSVQVPVARISGVEVMPGGESEAAPEETDMSSQLVGTTWQWVQTEYGDDSVLVPSDPSNYTLLFDGEGNVAVQLDCNSGMGSYTLDGTSLLFGPIASTLMACLDDSQATEFANDLAEVYSFVMQDGHLFLSLKLDSGIMEFAPVEVGAGATAEATEEATEEPTAEATEEATPEPTEEATVEATEEPAEEGASGDLAGTSWQWIQSIYEGDMVVLATDPSRYTLTFNEDGSVDVQLDCNSGSGTYTAEGSNLTFGAITSTRMACPADSQDGIFSEDLAAVVSYVIADGNLHLTLSTDGVMEFAPVE